MLWLCNILLYVTHHVTAMRVQDCCALFAVVNIFVSAAQLVPLVKVPTLLIQICVVLVTIGERKLPHHRRVVETLIAFDNINNILPWKRSGRRRLNYVAKDPNTND